MTQLVIVESPAKCSKIQEYLGAGYRVLSSMGHIRALKQDLDAVGINDNWTPSYEIMGTKSKTVKQLREIAAGADGVILATDDDREGEGIAFHICSALKLDPRTTPRIVFHSITPTAIQEAINNPRLINMDMFHAQQTRAMLDMMIGYTLSPVLWKQLNSNGLPLSAGRCQTPALKLVLDRDLEIEAHKAKRFWSLSSQFLVAGIKEAVEAARENLESDEATKDYLQPATTSQKATLVTVKESVRTHGAPKPLITSTLQQEASKSFGLNPKATMSAAQKLYEAGHITYMRTDNAFLSTEGAAACRKEIKEQWGDEYLGPPGQHQGVAGPAKQQTKTKKAQTAAATTKPEAQAAHEAIRPTHPERHEVQELGPMEAKVYRLIWQRSLQSQMAASTEDCRGLTFTLDADQTKSKWYGEQIRIKFLGWKVLSSSDKSEAKQKQDADTFATWSKVLANTAASWMSIMAEEGFTKPAGRFTEASLIHELETRGIGRPSTFASLVGTIIERGYVDKSDSPGQSIDIRKWTLTKAAQWPPKESSYKQVVGKESNKLQVTPLGRTVAEFIYKNYADIFDYTYTALMETELDRIAKGERPWKTLLQTNWDTYKARYEAHIANPSEESKTKAGPSKRELGEGIQVILSRKGPLLLRGEKDFTSLPRGTSYESITLNQAKAAYEAKAGEELGTHNDLPILKKKGPYGFYAQCGEVKVPYKPEDTLQTVIAKIEAKSNPHATGGAEAPYERKVGDFTIKRGPYGLYFFKHTLKKATFVKFTLSDPDKATTAELQDAYDKGAASAASRRRFKKK